MVSIAANGAYSRATKQGIVTFTTLSVSDNPMQTKYQVSVDREYLWTVPLMTVMQVCLRL